MIRARRNSETAISKFQYSGCARKKQAGGSLDFF
jgi:hypothetical protein